MQTQYIAPFIAAVHNNTNSIPVDFVSTHFYPTDPECQTASTKSDPDCFSHTILAEQKLAKAAKLPLFITAYSPPPIEAPPPPNHPWPSRHPRVP